MPAPDHDLSDGDVLDVEDNGTFENVCEQRDPEILDRGSVCSDSHKDLHFKSIGEENIT